MYPSSGWRSTKFCKDVEVQFPHTALSAWKIRTRIHSWLESMLELIVIWKKRGSTWLPQHPNQLPFPLGGWISSGSKWRTFFCGFDVQRMEWCYRGWKFWNPVEQWIWGESRSFSFLQASSLLCQAWGLPANWGLITLPIRGMSLSEKMY